MDVDLDLKDRNDLLKNLENYIEASRIKDNNIYKHPSGIYLQNIPKDKETNLSSISFENAEKYGFFKIDLLNNHAYSEIEEPEELDAILSMEPDWNLLKNKEVVQLLPHIHNHFEQLQEFEVNNIHELAAFLALIRPGKIHLMGKPKEFIMKNIWVKNNNEKYFFKKSHAYAYAFMIIANMNLIKLKRE